MVKASRTARPAVDSLVARLRLPATASQYLYDLKAADAAKLLTAIAGAEAAQQKAVDAAIKGALDHVPMLLRGPVRKMLFGD
ncbi:MAG: hypothetical protein Q8Q73_02420 [Stagnimonas sp.]|nr:hypothetical protein [Stagnimonas sp.]